VPEHQVSLFVHSQYPNTQTPCGDPHAFVQPPQLFGSLIVSTQIPAQAVSFGAHAGMHCPPTHLRYESQTFPHVPQFALSLLVSAQYATPPSGLQ